MPAELPDEFSQIMADLAYFKRAVASMGVGGQPPTIYATKYIADIECLLRLAGLEPKAPVEAPTKSQLELSLDDDAAGRVERRPAKSKP